MLPSMALNSRSTWIRICAMAVLAMLLFALLSGAAAQPRTILGWQLEQFLSYFAVTLIVCAAWPRPLAIAGALVLISGVLEVLQGFTPDRTPNLMAALLGTAGAVVASTLAGIFFASTKQACPRAPKHLSIDRQWGNVKATPTRFHFAKRGATPGRSQACENL